MEHYIAVAIEESSIKENDNSIAESLMGMANVLFESTNVVPDIGLGESVDGKTVFMIELPAHPTEEQATVLAEKLANKLFDADNEDFDIYISTEDEQ
jgi:hypothetical protein|tara:strand:+ start:575 stop:865 length:291 start_codon:yes stop_codon:yes gene_type:complete